MDCSICCEKFNKSTRFKVECKGCNDDSVACRKCCQTFILSGIQNPSCMFCKSEWDRDFLNVNLTKKFVENDLKIFSENIFVERQIALLPDTQKDAAQEKKIRFLTEQCSEAKSELNRLLKQVHDQKQIIELFNVDIARLRLGETNTVTENNFTHKCNSANCLGFLNSVYFCTLCDTKFCKMCMEVKDVDHVCNEDTKASVQAINKEAKPCPGCGEMISKIDGCDQMWCVKCHVQFSWKTGIQITGYNHNPEYFRWMRETGLNIAVNPNVQNNLICGFGDAEIIAIISTFFNRSTPSYLFLFDMYRFYRHAEYVVRHGDFNNNNLEPLLKKLRIKYLLGDIEKDEWKKNLQQIDKKTKKNTAYRNNWLLIQTVLASFVDQIVNIPLEINPETKDSIREEYLNLIVRAKDFKTYINESFLNISNMYKSSSCPGIDDNWREVYNLKTHLKKIAERQTALKIQQEQNATVAPIVAGRPRLGGGFD